MPSMRHRGDSRRCSCLRLALHVERCRASGPERYKQLVESGAIQPQGRQRVRAARHSSARDPAGRAQAPRSLQHSLSRASLYALSTAPTRSNVPSPSESTVTGSPSAIVPACVTTAEDALARHDAVADLVIDRAVVVADLAVLAHLKPRRADLNHSAKRQREQVESGDREVLAEVARVHVGASIAHALHRLHRKQAHLPMPVARVCVAGDPSIEHRFDAWHGRLRDSRLGAHVDRDDSAFGVRFAHCALPSSTRRKPRPLSSAVLLRLSCRGRPP